MRLLEADRTGTETYSADFFDLGLCLLYSSLELLDDFARLLGGGLFGDASGFGARRLSGSLCTGLADDGRSCIDRLKDARLGIAGR